MTLLEMSPQFKDEGLGENYYVCYFSILLFAGLFLLSLDSSYPLIALLSFPKELYIKKDCYCPKITCLVKCNKVCSIFTDCISGKKS